MGAPFNQPRPGFIQYKGTDICLDLHCPTCHYDNHYDGRFAYVVECVKCKARWELSHDIQFRKYDPGAGSFNRDDSIFKGADYNPADDPAVAEDHNCTAECVGGYFHPEPT